MNRPATLLCVLVPPLSRQRIRLGQQFNKAPYRPCTLREQVYT